MNNAFGFWPTTDTTPHISVRKTHSPQRLRPPCPASPSVRGKWDHLPLGASSFITQLQSCEGRSTPESVGCPHPLCPSDSKGKGLKRKDEESTVVLRVKDTLLSPPSKPNCCVLLPTEFFND